MKKGNLVPRVSRLSGTWNKVGRNARSTSLTGVVTVFSFRLIIIISKLLLLISKLLLRNIYLK